MQIIGICGRKGSGKSTLQGQFKFARSYTVPFAQPLKLGLMGMGLPPDWFLNPAMKEVPQKLLQGKTPRHAMVTLGTEWGREMMGQDMWVDLWLHKINSLPEDATVIVDDVRFPQEVDMLRDLGALIVAVARSELDCKDPPHWSVRWWKERKTHPSERLNFREHDLPILFNNDTPEYLYEQFMFYYDLHVAERGT